MTSLSPMAPDGAPAGVETKFLPRPSSSAAWAQWLAEHPKPMTWCESRPKIRPRLILIHTNGAAGEGTRASAYNWSMAAPTNTKTHYQVDRDGTATKFIPSDRMGIAQAQANGFALSIETADLGWPDPGTKCGFTLEQGEMVAQIVAYESELWDIPIETPVLWNGEGVASHTDPFGYPYWTNVVGKPCPGVEKKLEVREWILPRAREIRFGSPQQEEELMELIQVDDGDAAIFIRDGLTCTWAGAHVDEAAIAGGFLPAASKPRLIPRLALKCLRLEGPEPDYGAAGGPTNKSSFAGWNP